MEGFTRANLFELSGDSIQITFSSTSILGARSSAIAILSAAFPSGVQKSVLRILSLAS